MLFFGNAFEVTLRIKRPGKEVKEEMLAYN